MKFNKKSEIDPLEIFNRIVEISQKFDINYCNEIHKEYLKRRQDLIKLIESICFNHYSDEECFFQAIFYLDKIIFQKKFLNALELFLYQNNNINNREKVFFKKFIYINNNYNFFNLENKNNIFSNINYARNYFDFDFLFKSLAIGCFLISSKLYINNFLQK
jgi:hypothetical protein